MFKRSKKNDEFERKCCDNIQSMENATIIAAQIINN